MRELRLQLPKPHKGQQRIIDEAARFNVVNCGRRFGKTTLGIDRVVEPSIEGYPVGWFSPTYKSLLEAWREARSTLRPVTSRANAQERRLEMITGGVVEMWSLTDPNAARGRAYKRAIFDEAALVPHLKAAWEEVVRPSLSDYEGDAYFFSTPKGLNYFKVLYDMAQNGNGLWRSWQMPTSANPYIPASEIELMREHMPERAFCQEILAHFLEDAGAVFRRVMDCATAEEAEPDKERSYVFGVDWGKHNDFTVVSVLDDQHRMATMDRFNQIDYAVQVGRLKALAERYKPSAIIAESNAMGEPLIEQLQRDGLPVRGFTTTNATKAAVIEALALAFERGEIAILPDPVLVGELQAYTLDRTPSGMVKYSAPAGMHDDTVMALALAYQGIARGRSISFGYVRTGAS